MTDGSPATLWARHLSASSASVRLHAALAVGSHPDNALIDDLIARCGSETDFYVRDMLTWALTRHPPHLTVPKLLAELHSDQPQSRSQVLHTLSEIKDPSTWPAITPALLADPDDEVARSAWRAAVILVPPEEAAFLAKALGTQLGRGDRHVQLSLSRALLALGASAVEPVLQSALKSPDLSVQRHAAATDRLLKDPDAAFELDITEARRAFVLSKER